MKQLLSIVDFQTEPVFSVFKETKSGNVSGPLHGDMWSKDQAYQRMGEFRRGEHDYHAATKDSGYPNYFLRRVVWLDLGPEQDPITI